MLYGIYFKISSLKKNAYAYINFFKKEGRNKEKKKKETITRKAFLKSSSVFHVPHSNVEKNRRQKPVIREKAKIAF